MFLADSNWLAPTQDFLTASRKLEGTNIILPVDPDNVPIAMYEELMKEVGDWRGRDKPLRIAAVNVGDKFDLFNSKLLSDTAFVAVVIIFSTFMMTLHSRSLSLALVSIAQMFCALGVAYFLFRVVLRFEFFSFLNVTMCFVVVAVGVDDVFVFLDAYRQSYMILPTESTLDSRLHWVFRRSFQTMLVTTLTTAAAFLANTISPITAIKTFGLFAAVVVIVDYILMMIILPAIVVIVDCKALKNLCVCCDCNRALPDRIARNGVLESHCIEGLFQKCLSPVVTHWLVKWIICSTLTGVGIGMLLYSLGLAKSNSEQLQLFTSGHPLEDWD